MHSIKTLCITLIHLQFCAIVLTATLPLPRSPVLPYGPECLGAALPQIPHTGFATPFRISLQDSPVNLSSHSIEFPGSHITYDVQPVLLDLLSTLDVFQKVVEASKRNSWSSPVGRIRIYRSDDVELLFFPEQVMTWANLGCAAHALRIHMDRWTNFSIFDKQWNLLGKGELGIF